MTKYIQYAVQILLVGSVGLKNISTRVTLWPFKVIQGVFDFAINRKDICDFLLVRHNNLGPILRHFRDIAGFCTHDPTPIPPNLGVFPLDQIADVGISSSRNYSAVKLLSKYSNVCDHGT